jgi:mono/diheme cytochrome c family protein
MSEERGLLLGWVVALGVILWGLATLTRAEPGVRNHEIFTEMAYSLAYEAYTPNPFLEDGKTMQPLVPGVVPRGTAPFPFGDGQEEATRAGSELHDPLPADDPAVATRGAELYRVYCLVCHDARGNGRGPVVLRGMLPPPSLHADRATQMADGSIFHVITRGQGNMASYASQLSPEERWAVVRHLRRLQQEGPE